ncbi:MAG TPA: hypothetical protein VK485_03760 [Sphingomicrobium sp.]|nr:hypothetical protein [Sphingomicrobium sp.]
MASIRNNVLLHIVEGQGNARVEVSYTVDASAEDLEHQQSYRAVVELIGVDEGPGEDGRSEVIPNGQIVDEPVTFSLPRTVVKDISAGILDEDPGPFPRRDEIRARITLLPTTLSNIVHRGAFVLNNQ